MNIEIQHRPERQRFEAIVDGAPCVVDYRHAGGVMTIVHTEVAPQLEGQGIAGQIVQAALDYARNAGWRVRPACSYARHYMQSHPETQALLDR